MHKVSTNKISTRIIVSCVMPNTILKTFLRLGLVQIDWYHKSLDEVLARNICFEHYQLAVAFFRTDLGSPVKTSVPENAR